MSDENATQQTFSTGVYREATILQSIEQPSDSTSSEGRVVSTGKTTGTVEVRVTTRQATVPQSTK